MNYRLSFVLLVILAVVGGYVLLFELQKRPELNQAAPWFYDVSYDEIRVIEIDHDGRAEKFEIVGNTWVFQHTQEPVDLERWSGIPHLLTGPRVTRQVMEVVEDFTRYGLAPPRTRITVNLDAGQSIVSALGALTPDGSAVYARLDGSPGLFLLPASWADVMRKLVTEPPIVTGTPTAES